MLAQHIDNLERRILQYQLSINDTASETVNETATHNARINCLLAVVGEHPEYTYEQYAEALHVSRSTIARHIKMLGEKGYIKRMGADKDGHWQVMRTYNKD